MLRLATLLALCVVAATAQDEGELNRLGLPNPPKPDVPYLIHASQIVELETLEANEEDSKNQLVYWLPGTSSAVKTPLAAPEFLIDSQEIDPRDLRLYGFEVVKGRRELVYRKKKKVLAQPYFLQLDGIVDRVVRIRVNGSLPAGEYGLTPDGSNAVFVFAVF